MSDAPPLDELLVQHASFLEGFTRKHAGSLLRLEALDDLVQGARLKALEAAGSFQYQGEAQLRSWLARVVRSYLADRHAYYSAGRRNAGHLIRVTQMGGHSSLAHGVDPATSRTGPQTFAERRDQVALAVQAIATLLPRDQQLLDWEREGLIIGEIAERLDMTPESAGRARLRALDRFRRAYELLSRGGSA